MFFSGKIKISSTGSYTPERIVTNEDLAPKVNSSPEWIYENLGITERRICEKNQFTSDLAANAGLSALKAANIDASEIDLLIVATSTPDRKAPSTACIVKHKMKMNSTCPAFDISAVCSGFIYALSIASDMMKDKKYKNVMLIGADTFSKITDWTRRDAVFFGDGAGAVILRQSDYKDALFSSILFSESSNPDHFTVHPEDDFFTMNGKAVFETGTKVLPEAIHTIMDHNHMTVDQIDYIIPHQPSIGILKETAKILELPFSKIKTNMKNYANTSGATIPLLLDEVNRRGEFKTNDKVVFAAVGSGWTWGAAIYVWH